MYALTETFLKRTQQIDDAAKMLLNDRDGTRRRATTTTALTVAYDSCMYVSAGSFERMTLDEYTTTRIAMTRQRRL